MNGMLKLIQRYNAYLLKEGGQCDPARANLLVGTVAMPWTLPIFLVLVACMYLKPNMEQRLYIVGPIIVVPALGAIYSTVVFLWASLRNYDDKLQDRHAGN
jgi:hypothetical protein